MSAGEGDGGPPPVWALGDYPDLAKTIEDVSQGVVDEVGAVSGQDFLDVATGSGNAALAAARAGAKVTGLDLTPDLLVAARERAAAEGLDITFEEGDAERLPYPDANFDRVVSVFGAMFAPDQEAAAAELLRVRRPDGVLAVTAWTPEGLNGQMFGALGKHMPPPPEGFRPPILWGDEDHVRQLFADADSIRCEKRVAEDSARAESVDSWLDYMETVLGPMVLAKQALGERWSEARADLHALYEQHNEADDGTFRARPEYLLAVVG